MPKTKLQGYFYHFDSDFVLVYTMMLQHYEYGRNEQHHVFLNAFHELVIMG